MLNRTVLVRTSILATVMSLTLATWSVSAQEQAGVTLTGETIPLCTLGNLSRNTDNPVNFDTPGGSVFSITQLADPITLSTRPAKITLMLEAMCNGLHRVIIASDNNGLWRTETGASSPGFGSAVPYSANLIWAETRNPLQAEASARRYVQQEILVGWPNAGDMLIEFDIDAGATNAGFGAPLLAGEYTDVLRVTVEPQ